MTLLAVGPKTIWGRFGPAVCQPGSGSGGGFVLCNDAGGDPPPFADRNALVLRPRPDVRTALPAGCTAPRPAVRSPARLARVGDERCELPTERRGIAGAQVDLVL